jgi:hypothetical protein
MVRASKSAVEKTPATPVVAPEVVESAAAPVVAKKARKPKVVAQETAPVVESVIPSNEVVSESVVSPVLTEEPVALIPATESPILTLVREIGAKIQQRAILDNSIKSDQKLLEKLVTKSDKLALKNSHRKKKASGNRAPSGFTKPSLITDELANFLGKPHGTKLARTEVSKEINGYIKEHSLKDKDNGRKIIPDSKLTTLLRLNGDIELTYFNLQKYMKHHFIKETPAVVA